MNRRELIRATLAGVVSRNLIGLTTADAVQYSNHKEPAAPVALGDRWLEIDLYWFRLDDISGSVQEFWDRYFPLCEGVEGYCGVVLNVGWTVEYVMDWPGDLSQRIVLPAASGQERWVAETSPLTGDWEQRKKEWKQRFAQPIDIERRGYEPWTYGDLKELLAALRSAASDRGIRNFKVGSLALAWPGVYGTQASLYGTATTFFSRHPEAFTTASKGPNFFGHLFFDPGNALHKDEMRLGGLPTGIPEGMPVHQVFGAQWGSLSSAVGIDALMLRDSFGFPIAYARTGPDGPLAPSPDVARRFSYSVAALVRETKQANPKALLMMYSNGASAVGDWRCNCCDLEAIAREGYLDIFVDQTWAGDWNELGVREKDFWNRPSLGYTYQLAYLLMHAAILANTKVRHYPVIEVPDAWESEDILHTVPERLRWEIWAYAHAGVKTPNGLKLPAGTYTAIVNRGDRLLSREDVHFLATNINEAARDASRTREIFGPTLVYSRETMQWQMDHASPDNDIKEWIDEEAGSVMKWPLPILSATRMEWLSKVQSDLFILQTPVQLSDEHKDVIVQLIESGKPIAIFGSPVGGISPELERLVGLIGVKNVDQLEHIHAAKLGATAQDYASNLPASFPTLTRLSLNRSAAEAHALYSVDGSPALTLDTREGKRVLTWDPPTFVGDSDSRRPLVDFWGGSAAPYALTAGALNTLLSSEKVLHVEKIDMNQTMSICAWRAADGSVRLLVANLEEGLRNLSDASCHATLVLPENWRATALKDLWSGDKLKVNIKTVALNLDQAQSKLFMVEA